MKWFEYGRKGRKNNEYMAIVAQIAKKSSLEPVFRLDASKSK
jgi:hypothetical protein